MKIDYSILLAVHLAAYKSPPAPAVKAEASDNAFISIPVNSEHYEWMIGQLDSRQYITRIRLLLVPLTLLQN
jgi:hypothetical protein